MDRTLFILVTSVILMVAFTLGWLSHWLLHRFARVPGGHMDEMDHLAQSLHEAEEARDQAIRYLEHREAELEGQISQMEAELRATMEGLRVARTENEEMRAWIEKTSNAS
jgi:prophage endopeptidase